MDCNLYNFPDCKKEGYILGREQGVLPPVFNVNKQNPEIPLNHNIYINSITYIVFCVPVYTVFITILFVINQMINMINQMINHVCAFIKHNRTSKQYKPENRLFLWFLNKIYSGG